MNKRKIMIRLHQCYPNLYYLHSSVYENNDWNMICQIQDRSINQKKHGKEAIKDWLGIDTYPMNISISHHVHGTAIYCDSNIYPMFYISSIDYTLYYFFIDIHNNDTNLVKSTYNKLFNHIRTLDKSNMTLKHLCCEPEVLKNII